LTETRFNIQIEVSPSESISSMFNVQGQSNNNKTGYLWLGSYRYWLCLYTKRLGVSSDKTKD